MTVAGRNVLLLDPSMSPIIPALEKIAAVHCLWHHPSTNGFFEQTGPAIRAIITAGDRKVDSEILAKLPNLQLVACVSAGYDGLDTAWCAAHGIWVTASTGINAGDVADHALGMIIAARRGLLADDSLIRSGGWTAVNRVPARHSLGKTSVGIVGLGAIGRAAAVRLRACDMTLAWWGPREHSGSTIQYMPSLAALAEWCNVLLVCCRADASTRHLIDRSILDAVGPNGLLVNVARGSVVDEDALIAALQDGRLAQAALDVFAEEPTPASRWANVPNVLLTPHTAGLTQDTVVAMIGLAVRRMDHFLSLAGNAIDGNLEGAVAGPGYTRQ